MQQCDISHCNIFHMEILILVRHKNMNTVPQINTTRNSVVM